MNMSTKKGPGRSKLLVSPAWNKILKIWDTLLSSSKKKYNAAKITSKFFYHKKLELLEITLKKSRKSNAHQKNINIKYIQRIFALPAMQWKW